MDSSRRALDALRTAAAGEPLTAEHCLTLRTALNAYLAGTAIDKALGLPRCAGRQARPGRRAIDDTRALAEIGYLLETKAAASVEEACKWVAASIAVPGNSMSSIIGRLRRKYSAQGTHN